MDLISIIEVIKLNHDTNVLNKVLKGENMAAEIIQIYVENLQDDAITETLSTWIKDHKQNANKIGAYLLLNGESPRDGLGVIGMLSKVKAKMNTNRKAEPLDILREIYDGEDKGLARATQLAENNVTQDARDLLEDIFRNDHDHLQEMKSMISQYEKENNQQVH